MAARARALGISYEIHYSARQRARMALLPALREMHGDRLHVYVGEEGLRALATAWGLQATRAYMSHVLDHAEERVRQTLLTLRDGHFHYPTDRGDHIHVTITVDRAARRLVSGTDPELVSHLEIRDVSPAVNSVKNNSPELLRPVAAADLDTLF